MKNKYHIITFGCAMNKSDSERIAALLENFGYQKTPILERSDLAIINACSVRQSAIDRLYDKAKKLQILKQKRKMKAILTGCLLEKDRQQLASLFDLIFNIKDLESLPNFLLNSKTSVKIIPDTPLLEMEKKLKKAGKLSPEEESYLKIYPKRERLFSALIAISNGCNKFCTYCAVPYTRGFEVNRPAKDIILECQEAIKQGAKEIILLGQTVNSYRDKDGVTFAQLLRKINELAGKFWISFQSPYPTEFNEETISALAQCEKVAKIVNLPLQSGDNNVLKRMNRRYTVEEYKKVVARIREAIPHIALATDIIVGFSGETEEEFQNTARVMEEIKYDMAYIAKYSPRPGTVAEKYFKDDVPPQIKKQRYQILTEILKKTALEKNLPYQDKIVEVLIFGNNKKYLFGKTYWGKKVILPLDIKNKTKLIGNFAKVRITEIFPFVLKGELI